MFLDQRMRGLLNIVIIGKAACAEVNVERLFFFVKNNMECFSLASLFSLF